MSKCLKCQKILPPDFLTLVKEDGKICVWCEKEIDTLTYIKDGKEIKVTKENVVKEYQMFMKLLMENKKVRSIVLGSKERS